MKIPTQHPQAHGAAVAAECVIPASLLSIARLQSSDRRLHSRMPSPGLAEFHGCLTLLTLGLHMARHGQAGLSHHIRQLGLIRRRALAEIFERNSW